MCSRCGKDKPKCKRMCQKCYDKIRRDDMLRRTDIECAVCGAMNKAQWYTGPKCSSCYRREANIAIGADQGRINRYLYRYGITKDDYQIMLDKQGGVCGICKIDKPQRKDCEYMFVDHCHKSRKVRGLLCSNCNAGLGSFKDREEFLNEAINYLRRAA